jgi:hypothetical protein
VFNRGEQDNAGHKGGDAEEGDEVKTRYDKIKGFFIEDTLDITNKEVATRFDRWVWRADSFPYPVWQFRKFRIYHPPEVLTFFSSYKDYMGIAAGKPGKEFFNYCKLVVYDHGKHEGNVLMQEIQFAEATARFYAGAYSGLVNSWLLIMALVVFQLAIFWNERPQTSKLLNLCITVLIACALYRMKEMIKRRFRTLRLKEVDTVYDAFYLVHRHADHCEICSNKLAKTKSS